RSMLSKSMPKFEVAGLVRSGKSNALRSGPIAGFSEGLRSKAERWRNATRGFLTRVVPGNDGQENQPEQHENTPSGQYDGVLAGNVSGPVRPEFPRRVNRSIACSRARQRSWIAG